MTGRNSQSRGYSPTRNPKPETRNNEKGNPELRNPEGHACILKELAELRVLFTTTPDPPRNPKPWTRNPEPGMLNAEC